jgi:subtilisin family serine protease
MVITPFLCVSAANGKIVGVAPHALLADYRVLGVEGGGSYLSITRAIYQATLDGCHIINLSLGGRIAYHPMHAAVGNEGDRNPATEEISYPGYYHEVCGAGAVQISTSADDPSTIKDAYFSNTNREVDIAAPGWQVWSTIPGGYAAYSGTLIFHTVPLIPIVLIIIHRHIDGLSACERIRCAAL